MTAVAGTGRSAVHDDIDRESGRVVEAVRQWVRLGSFSDTGEGMDESASYILDALRTVAPDAEIVQTEGHPVVFGTSPCCDPDAPTLLVYGLYDVTPTVASEWSVDPLAADIVDPAAIGVPGRLGPLIVGRGVNNHKGPVMAALQAIRLLKQRAGDLPVNLIFVIEGEEEIGSPSLARFVDSHRDVLATASGVWLPTMQQNSGGVMTLRRSYKGSLWFGLECRGGEWGGPGRGTHLWAGHSAWIDAPMMHLVKAVSSLFDDDQRASIDGLSGAPVAGRWRAEIDRIRAAFDANPQWERNMAEILGVSRYLRGRPLSEHLEHYMCGVSLNVQGFAGGYQGPGYYTMLPGHAAAKVDLRFPPGMTVSEVHHCLRGHLDRRGFASVEVTGVRGYEGADALPESEDTLLVAARRTAQRQGIPMDVWPLANNCSPAALLARLDRAVPFSVAGAGHGERAHAPDEYCTVGSVAALMHWTVDYLHDWAAVGPRPGRTSDQRGN